MTTEQFIPFNVQPPPDANSITPREIKTPMNDIEEIESYTKK